MEETFRKGERKEWQTTRYVAAYGKRTEPVEERYGS